MIDEGRTWPKRSCKEKEFLIAIHFLDPSRTWNFPTCGTGFWRLLSYSIVCGPLADNISHADSKKRSPKSRIGSVPPRSQGQSPSSIPSIRLTELNSDSPCKAGILVWHYSVHIPVQSTKLSSSGGVYSTFA